MNELDDFDQDFLLEQEEQQKRSEIERQEKEDIKKMDERELRSIKSQWTTLDDIWTSYIDTTSKKIISVKTKWLIENLMNFDLDISKFFLQDGENDFGTVSNNNDRVSRILNHWRKNIALDPPLITVENDRLTIIDGRHRLKTAILLQDECMPIIINKNFEVKELGSD